MAQRGRGGLAGGPVPATGVADHPSAYRPVDSRTRFGVSANYAGLPAPAKLNLFLHVTGRRSDGYHTLQTLFTFLDYGDALDFSILPDGQVRRLGDDPGFPEQDDLCIKAARLLKEQSGVAAGAGIRLTKRIPVGGGLGGGSSDAATTLVALNHLWGIGWERSRLAALGLRLGADVPVFVEGRAAFAEGVGERLTPCRVPESWYLVACPAVAISTREIFAAPELTRDSIPVKMCDFSAGFGHNDLQPVVVQRYPQVASLLQWLGQWGDARMTGSGSCCFVPFAEGAEAREALGRLPPEYTGFVARGMNQHPLRDWL
ncbi:MAG: 4-(cytidine 5'-diphospho)-2-C-methyl-D-erythritol kinase [Betaproteobacteria bacterium]|nr:4-(cytidine 5'-diphospho)-2-C-methyl-D-erythritol kinase [Betaproteobacteria bacterium]MDE2621681.1 4-(cytidine 5'-diphospho)-2-C-methyl-D-erythritol kinase [Betaproteobacteria bacterium]